MPRKSFANWNIVAISAIYSPHCVQVASIETSAIHLDILRDLKQINSLLASAAYPVLQQYGELLDSRLVKTG